MESSTPYKRRRHYTPEFKAKVAACLQLDASIAQVALQHGLNSNLVQAWNRKSKRQSPLPAAMDFVPLPVPATIADLPSSPPPSG